MGIGKSIEKRNHIIGFKEEIQNAKKISEEDFFIWFNSDKNLSSTFVRGAWDVSLHILEPIAPYVDKPEEKIVLEIGMGGGRLLAAIAKHFKSAIGIDIHDYTDFVKEFLRKEKGIDNIDCLQTDGKKIPLDDSSIDIVYSFIVMQHVEKIEVFKNYINETYRVLKPGGIAIIYFGRYSKFSHNQRLYSLYIIDLLFENILMKNGYIERVARVNESNLFISYNYAKTYCKKVGFKILKRLVSHKDIPDGLQLFGGQHGIVLKKIW